MGQRLNGSPQRRRIVKIFVTGATGVVGRHLVPRLVQAGHQVTAIGRTQKSRDELAAAGAHGVGVDLFDREAVKRAVAGQDTVINLATHMPASIWRMFLPGAWKENDRIRRDASAILVDAALAGRVRRFIQESFAPIYAPGGDRWLDETWPQAAARYNRTVLDAERSAARFTEAGGTGIVLRFASFYGPDDFARTFVRSIRGGWSPLPGSPDAYFSSISHEDAASAVMAVLGGGTRAGTYNVTDDEPLRRREYVEGVAAMLGVRKIRYTPRWVARIGGTVLELLSRSQRMSNAKLERETGWRPIFRNAVEGWRETLSQLGEVRQPGAPLPLTRHPCNQ
jgi:nucleoside-diphosphate-sugar epimerase